LAVETLEQSAAPFFVAVNKNLGMTARSENVATFLEFSAKFRMIEDIAVRGEDDLAILVCDRLGATITVDGGQPDMGEPDFLAGVETKPVGAAVPY